MRKFTLGIAFILAAGLPAVAATPITFNKDVAPIFYNRCVECHRAGEVAPMPLLTYKDARPWAAAIKEKVASRTMPPWLADPKTDHFANSRRLSDAEIKTISAWVDAGAPKGDDRDLPAPPKFETGWALGKPDVIFQIPEEVSVPASGTVAYQYYTVPTNFTEDKWIQSSEIRAGNRAVVHHIIVFIQEPPKADAGSGTARAEGGRTGLNKLSGFAPGEQAKVFPPGTAKLIKAGSKLTFQVHYTTNGAAATDRSYIGLHFAKGDNLIAAQTGTATNHSFVIPAGDGNYEAKSSWTAPADVRVIDLMPHMHVRGKDFKYTAVYPDGHSEVLLDVPQYDFNWQLLYRYPEPLHLPKGTRIDCVAHFDNSAQNKYNPDATKDVKWGDQTWEEMMIGWFDYVVEPAQAGQTR